MRIDRLDLTAFGPFTDVSLDLSGGGEVGGMHLIFGLNEAGKSSALRAIQQFFCGIESRSTDNFVHDHSKMRIGVSLRNSGGGTESYVRRKGLKNTLLGADDKALEDGDARLARRLCGIQADEYVKKFVIDHGELIAGGEAVLKAGGDLGRALFAAASGMVGLGEVQRKLDGEAEDLFKKGGKIPKINAALAELEKYKKETKERSLKGSEWLGHDRALHDARARKEALGRELAEKEGERKRLKSLADALGPIARRKEVVEELAGLADVPKLDKDFTANRREALASLKPAEVREAGALREIALIQETLAGLTVPEELLAQEKAIEALFLRLGARKKSETDRVRLELERAGFEDEARAAFRELGRDPLTLDFRDDAPGVESLHVRAADRSEIQELSNSRQALLQERDGSAKTLQKHTVKQEAAAAKLATLGPERENKTLNKVIKAAQRPGELETQIDDAREKIAKETRKAETALKALGRWTGPLDAADSLQVPQSETIEHFEAGFEAATKDEVELGRELDTLDTESRQAASDLEKLRLTGDVPTEDALTEAREKRDALWQALRDKGARDEAMALEFETATRRADEISDRLRREAGRVLERANLIAGQSRQRADRDDLSVKLDQSRARRDALNARWSALWSPLEIAPPGTPREMNAWLRKHAKLAEDLRGLREAVEALAIKEALAESLRNALGAALDDLGEAFGESDETFAGRIERAQSVIKSIDHEINERKASHKEIDKLEADRSDLEEKAATACARWRDWEASWAAAMKKIGQSADVSPKSAVTVLEHTSTLFDRLNKVRDCQRKLEEMEREAARFATDVQTLTARVALDLVPEEERAFDPEAIAAALNIRLGKARSARQKRDAKHEELGKQEAAARAALDDVIKSKASLEALRREARCDSDDALPDIEERSAHRQDLEKKRADLDDKLRVLADKTPLERFLKEAAATDPDAVDPQIASLDDQIKELNVERETLDQTIGQENTYLKQMNGDSRAAESGQEAEDLRARIKFEVEQYARLRLASAVLRDGIERYREKAHGPVVERASSLFAALTLGSFTGLKVDYDHRDEQVLMGVRGDGSSLGVGGMSLGTADQLYLALRLATLDLFLDGREPLPLIVDDILIQFDDARASATLKILAGLAERTQVLVFTHHEHLCELARKIAPANRLKTHVLPGPMILR